MTEAVISTSPNEDTESEEAERAIDERAYGFWIYLMTDAILFALLFAIFVVISHNTTEAPGGHTLFRFPNIFAQTMLLLASSGTFGFAAVALTAGQRLRTLAWLGTTLLLGLGFVAMKIAELYGMAAAGDGPWRSGFLSAFFTLIGTHGIHVSVGLVWMVLLGCELALRGLNPLVASRLYRIGLFWHFLDMIWISIFSVVYLPAFL